MHAPFLGLKETMFMEMLTFAQDPAPKPRSPEPPAHQDAPAPEPHPDLKPLVETIQKLFMEQKFADVVSQSDALLQQAIEKSDKIGQAYAHKFRAQALQGLNRPEEALPAWEQAERLWREVGDGAFLVEALLGRAIYHSSADQAKAEQLVAEAIRLAQQEINRPIAVARALGESGIRWYRASVLHLAEQSLKQTLQLLSTYHPDSVEVARCLVVLSTVVRERGNLRGAQEYAEQAVELCRRIDATSREMANALNSLAGALFYQGNLDDTQKTLNQTLRILEQILPDSLELANVLHNLGMVADLRGYSQEAYRYFEESLRVKEAIDSNSIEVALTLNSLGTVTRRMGDLETAWLYYHQALAIRNEKDPVSLETARVVNNLGKVCLLLGRLSEAEVYLNQALAIRQHHAPGSLDMTNTLSALGDLHFRKGDYNEAQQYYFRALHINQQHAPVSVDMAATLVGIGDIFYYSGNLDEARRYYEQSIEIYKRLAPWSTSTAVAIHCLARLELAQARYEKAVELLGEAIDYLEKQRLEISDTEIRSLFSEHYFSSYNLIALAYLQLSQPEKSAEVLERSRARSLAETLQQRQLPRKNLPPALQHLLAEQDQLNAQRLRFSQQLRQLEASDDDKRQQFLRQQSELNQRQRELDNRLRKEFPDFARQYLLTPFTFQQIQQSLDAGTVLLYHALMEDHLLIVAVSRTQVQGVARKLDGKQLEGQVKAFHRLISRAEDLQRSATLPPRSESERRELTRQAQQLYHQLIAPVQGMLSNAQRVLLCPDGVLSQLPWAALVVKTENGNPVYWIERVALHITPSIGVYRQARAVQPAKQGALIAYVSSGVNYPPKQPSPQAVAAVPPDRETRGVTLLLGRSATGRSLAPLKYAPREAQLLQQALRPTLKNVQVAKEAQATPQRARQLAQNARVVHLICHGQANNTDPLGSALLLTPVGKDAGMLTAGEVLLGWKLRADLVMLSACETGLGVMRRYEGVYSLGRAFLVAGSRSVGVSLWKVSDASTAVLMEAFYKQYAKGVPKDTALREAQRTLRRNPRYADPYFWAGFVLMGDYR